MIHPAAQFQFGRVIDEYARWRAVAETDRSPAPAWWWGPAFAVSRAQDAMPHDWPQSLELPSGASYADGAAVLLNFLAEQTSLPWPDEFPHKYKPASAD